MIAVMKQTYLKMGALATGAFFILSPTAAYAYHREDAGIGSGSGGGTVGGIIESSTSEMSNVPTLISWVAYLAGAGLGMAGIFKLRQHVDSPAQTPMKDGLVRLAAAGALLSLPVIMSAMTDFVGGDNTASNSLPSMGPNGS